MLCFRNGYAMLENLAANLSRFNFVHAVLGKNLTKHRQNGFQPCCVEDGLSAEDGQHIRIVLQHRPQFPQVLINVVFVHIGVWRISSATGFETQNFRLVEAGCPFNPV